jgi:ASC-1-like (ASCH) protein
MHTSLRIKKIYMDRIRAGTKTVEYRKNSEFYRRMFRRKIKTLTLHYQRRERLTVEVKCVRLIARPKRFVGDDMLPTEKIYAISLGKVLSHIA